MTASITRSVQESEAGKRVDQLLTALDEIVSRAQAQRLIKSGNVLLNGNPECAPSKKVRAGQEISVTIPPPESTEVLPEKGVLDILYEDEYLIVINKAAGVVVHPSAGHASGTLVNFLIHHCQDLSGIGGIIRPGIVHRIDKDTSGVLVIAKTDDAHLHLSNQFKQHSVKRQYQCLVWGVPEKEHGVVNAALGRHPVRRKDMSIVENDNPEESGREKGKSAVTHWRVLRRFEFSALLACRLETGRTHQIRVHMSYLGCPIVGDLLYGNRRMVSDLHGLRRQFLHAASLKIAIPKGDTRIFNSPLPKDLENVLTQSREG